MARDGRLQGVFLRVRLWASGVFLMALWVLVLSSLRPVLILDAWFSTATFMCALTISVGCLLQTIWPKWRGAAGFLAIFAGFLYLFWRFHSSGRDVLWWNAPRETREEVQKSIADGVAPLEPIASLIDVLLVAVFLALFITAMLFFGLNSPFAAGIFVSLLLLVTPAVTRIPPSSLTLLTTGLLLCSLAWLGSPRIRMSGLVASFSAVAIAAGIVAVMPKTADRVWNGAVLVSPVSSTVPDVTIALADDLKYRSNTVAFTYDVPNAGTYRFTLSTLADFTGGRWLPEDELNATGLSVLDARYPVLPPTPGKREISDDSRFTFTFSMEGLVSSWLPLPQHAVAALPAEEGLDLEEWQWSKSANTARSESAMTKRGDKYSVIGTQLLANRSSAEDLSISGDELFPNGDNAPSELEPYLALPGELPSEIVADAAEVVGELGDRAAVAGALQSWFHKGNFVYDLNAPYEPGMDADDPYAVMSKFLETKSGFCVHYATTFAVMARLQGVPTRVAVGYASRAENLENNVVRGRELHAWPEVYFDDIGWVAYEPTPGGAGFRADTGTAETEGPEIDPTETPSPTSEPAPTPTEQTPEQSPQSGAGTGGQTLDKNDSSSYEVGIVLIGALLLLAVVFLPMTVRRIRKFLRLRGRGKVNRLAQGAWDEFADTVCDLGLIGGNVGGGPRARTPEALVEYLGENGFLSPGAFQAAHDLSTLAADEQYNPLASPAHSNQVKYLLQITTSDLRASASKMARIRAAMVPRSVFTNKNRS